MTTIPTAPHIIIPGSGCGAIGRVFSSDIRGPGFESSHRQLLLNIYSLLTFCRKDENKEKEAGNGPFLRLVAIIFILVEGFIKIIFEPNFLFTTKLHNEHQLEVLKSNRN